MKIRFFLLFSCCILASNFLFADIDISLQPMPVVAGEPATLSIRSTDERAEITELPEIENLKWISPGAGNVSVMIINGKRFEVTNYQFVVSKTGEITIPSLKIKVGDNTFETQEKKITVTRGPLTDLEKYIFLDPVYETNPDSAYIGEVIPLKIRLYNANQLSSNPVEYPQIQLDNVMFGNFSSINRENDRFAPYPYQGPTSIEKDGITYTETSFYTTIIPMTTGKLTGSVSVLLKVVLPNQNRRRKVSAFDDDFFNMPSFFGEDPFFNRNNYVSKLISAKLPVLNVLPLPPSPGDVNFLSLYGKWNVQFSSIPEKLKEGETLTITVTIEGKGSLESLKTPQLSIPGFTAYPPEVNKYDNFIFPGNKPSKAVITYILIPTESGKNNVAINFATFDTTTGTYTLFPFNKTFVIEKNNLISSSSYVAENTQSKHIKNTETQEQKQSPKDTILYLKKNITPNILIPLWKNNIELILLFLLAGPILLIGFELTRLRNSKINKNECSKRRYKAKKEKNYILKKLKKKKSEELPTFVNNEVIKLINDLSGYPPGTSIHELEHLVNNKELVECLKQIDALSYMPGIENTGKELKNKLYKTLKKFSMVLIFCFIFLTGFKIQATQSLSPIEHFSIEYNKGEFKKAEEICLNNIKNNSPNPSWLYNLGECYTQEGDFAKAMVCYQRALLLSPRDSDVLQNLNYVRSKLFLPNLYTSKNPTELIIYLRDMFRPDEWLLIFSIAIFALFIALILRHFSRNIVWGSLLSASCIIAVLSLSASITQYNTLYTSNIAIILERNTEVYSLPSEDSQQSKTTLTPGESVKIEDKMGDWILITNDKTTGWVKKSTVEEIWPYV